MKIKILSDVYNRIVYWESFIKYIYIYILNININKYKYKYKYK